MERSSKSETPISYSVRKSVLKLIEKTTSKDSIKKRDALRAKTSARKKRRKEIAALPKNKKEKKSYMKGYRQRQKVKKKRMEEAKLPENIAWKNNYNKTVPPKRRKEVIRDLGGKCFVCGTNRQLEFHHIKYTRSSKLNWNEVEAKEHPENLGYCVLNAIML